MFSADRLLYKFLKFERTYSQCGEDKILSFLFRSHGKSKISYLDIGTNHPLMSNNTYTFYRQGSSGVCIEPNPHLCELIKKKRPRDTCFNIGLGTEETTADFYLMSAHTLSTFSKEDALSLDAEGKYKIKEILKIPVRTINSLLAENFEEPVDLVSIDVEGWNKKIVESIDFSQHRPFCFCVETVEFSESHPRKLYSISEVFNRNDYSVYADTFLNTVFVDKRLFGSEQSRLLKK
jgi:FkbM family methyltransferase